MSVFNGEAPVCAVAQPAQAAHPHDAATIFIRDHKPVTPATHPNLILAGCKEYKVFGCGSYLSLVTDSLWSRERARERFHYCSGQERLIGHGRWLHNRDCNLKLILQA